MRKLLFGAEVLFAVGLVLAAFSFPDTTSFFTQFRTLELSQRTEVVGSFFEAIALIIAGLWTYELYIRNRYDHPYPKIAHQINYHRLGGGMIYLSVLITVINEGKTKLDLGKGVIYVRQILPLTEKIKDLIIEAKKRDIELIKSGKIDNLFRDTGQRIGWLSLGTRNWKEQLRDSLKKLEPGQTRETQFDFLIMNDEVEVIQVISYFNFGRSHWELATLHSLKEVRAKIAA